MSDKEDPPNDTNNKDQKVEAAKQLINRYRSTYKSVNPETLWNLSDLKNTISEPKIDNPDVAAQKIQEHLHEAESGETFRIERWHGVVKCPSCKSEKVKRLAIDEQKSKDIYRYRCLSCNESFNDDTETKLETGVPSMHTWMFCWYLLGVTNSVQYIATKLNLNVATVELMIQHMRRLFQANEPLKHVLSFDEWAISHGKGYKTALQEALAKQVERFRGFSVGQESDTAEVRRAKNAAKPKPKF